VENCGSGGMRADYGMLKNFCIQSTSDQEIYYYYPSIAQGMLANILPEHAGIWSFPYPNLFDLRSDETAMEREAERCANGRQTVFNMVTAIAGNLYLSGRIDYADDFNSALIAEGIEYFKSIRPFKSEASAVFPNGFADISSLGEFATLGLINREKGRLLIFFWKYGGKKTEFKVPVK
jgi:alpha-galactosidase